MGGGACARTKAIKLTYFGHTEPSNRVCFSFRSIVMYEVVDSAVREKGRCLKRDNDYGSPFIACVGESCGIFLFIQRDKKLLRCCLLICRFVLSFCLVFECSYPFVLPLLFIVRQQLLDQV